MESGESKEENKQDGDEKEEDKGQAPNAGNGGKTDKYEWEQNLNEVTVNILLPEGTTSKMLNIDLKAKSFKFGLKGKEPMIAGDWNKPIKVDDSIWCIETDK